MKFLSRRSTDEQERLQLEELSNNFKAYKKWANGWPGWNKSQPSKLL